MTFDDCKTPMDAANRIAADYTWSMVTQFNLEALPSYVYQQKLEGDITTAIQHFCNRTLEQQRAGTVPHMAHDVREFMRMAGQPLPTKPGWPSEEVMDLAVRLKAEEFLEWIKAIGYCGQFTVERFCAVENTNEGFYEVVFNDGVGSENNERSLCHAADALIDDLYVTIGRLLDLGVDPAPLWREVHAANMAKLGGPVVNGKLKKPSGWTPPDIEARLREQGWEG